MSGNKATGEHTEKTEDDEGGRGRRERASETESGSESVSNVKDLVSRGVVSIANPADDENEGSIPMSVHTSPTMAPRSKARVIGLM